MLYILERGRGEEDEGKERKTVRKIRGIKKNDKVWVRVNEGSRDVVVVFVLLIKFTR